MYIREIQLYNFRQYRGLNKIDLQPSEDKNVVIVSGFNGFGKTNFLVALVWCLYGRDIDKIDTFFQKLVAENTSGGG